VPWRPCELNSVFFQQHDLTDLLNEVREAEEKSKKAMADAARLADELRQEQEHAMHVDRSRKTLELQIKELQVRLDEAEGAAVKGGKKMIQKMEERARELESQLEDEQRRHGETVKSIRKYERKSNIVFTAVSACSFSRVWVENIQRRMGAALF